jgi:hypothetical protein
MNFKEYDNAYSVFNDTSDQIGYFEDVMVAVKTGVSRSQLQNLSNKTEAAAAPLGTSWDLGRHDPPDPLNGYHSSGHFAHSSLLFQPPPNPNLPIARKSRAVFVEDHGDAPAKAAASQKVPEWEAVVPAALLAAPEPSWYDGNQLRCLQCGYSSRSPEQYEGHVRSEHHTEPADFAAFTEKENNLYRCLCCFSEVHHDKSSIRQHI